MENIILMMGNIMKENLNKEKKMEKVNYILKIKILYMMEILLMEIMKEMGNIFMKMEIIMKVNLKMDFAMEKEKRSIKMTILYVRENGFMMNLKKVIKIYFIKIKTLIFIVNFILNILYF